MRDAEPGPTPLPRPDAPADARPDPWEATDCDPAPGPLIVPDGGDLTALAERAAVYATQARGAGTQRAYRSAWKGYKSWCEARGRDPLDANPDTIGMYLVARADAGLAVSSLRVALA